MDGDSGSWLLWYAGSVFMAALLTLVCLEIGRFSGGKLKFLEESDEHLSERLDEVFPLKEEWLYAGRLLVILFTVSYVVFLVRYLAACDYGQNEQCWWRYCLKPLGILSFFYFIEEIAGALLSTAFSARLILVFIPIFKVIAWLFFPWTFLIASINRAIARKRIQMGDEGGDLPSVEDEILSLVEGESAAEQNKSIPDLEDDEKRMIRGALELDDITVRRVMTPRVDVVGVEYEPDMDIGLFVQKARATIVSSGHSRIPVYSDTIDNVIGVVYSKDLLDEAKTTDFNSLVHQKPLYIPVSKNIGDLLEEFRQNKLHLAVVVDEYGGTAGIVTFEDVLETLVGDIKDEYDGAEGSMEPHEIRPGVYLCDARVPVSIVNKILDVEIPEDKEYDTVGGYLSSYIGRIPEAGEEFHTGILNIIVTKAEHRRIIELEISPAQEE